MNKATLGELVKEGGGSIQTGPFGSQLHEKDYVLAGTPIISVEHMVDGRVEGESAPRVSQRDVQRLKRYVLAEGDVIFSRVGAIDRSAYISEKEDGWMFSGRLLRVRPGDSVDAEFLAYLLSEEEQRRWIFNNSVGSTMRCLNTSILSRVPLKLPSLEEQRRIAAILSALDERVEKTEALIEKKRLVKPGLMQELLAPGSENCRSVSDLPLPKGWGSQPLSSFIERFESGVSVNSDDRPAQGQEVGILKTSCVYGGRFKIEENKSVWSKDRKRVRVNPRAGSIIISRMNTPDLVGESGYVDQSYGHIFLPDRLWQTVARTSVQTDFRWLAQVLQWALVKKQIKDAATGTSNSMKNISQGAFLGVLVPTPPFKEQRRIAAILSAADEAINVEQNELTKLRLSKAGLMCDLLTGKVRVSA